MYTFIDSQSGEKKLEAKYPNVIYLSIEPTGKYTNRGYTDIEV